MIDLKGKAYKNLPSRLRVQARNVSDDGWSNAGRLMLNAAETLEYLVEQGVIEMEIDGK